MAAVASGLPSASKEAMTSPLTRICTWSRPAAARLSAVAVSVRVASLAMSRALTGVSNSAVGAGLAGSAAITVTCTVPENVRPAASVATALSA